MKEYYDRKGRVISRDEWSSLHSDPAYQTVVRTNIETTSGNFSVSTVWLGIDHSYGPDSSPMIFETIIFPEHGDWDYLERYGNEVSAVLGHARAIQVVLDGETEDF